MTNNPWNVSDSSVFLKYCCPECDFQCPHLYNFEEHAVGTHELSKILFENNSLKEESSSEIFEPTIHLKEDFENEDQEVYDEILVKEEYREGKDYLDDDQNYAQLSNSYHTSEAVERPPNYEKYWLGEKEGKCNFCGKHVKNLQHHILWKHETYKPWKCKECPFSHALKHGLKNHIKIHHPVPGDQSGLTCYKCGHEAENSEDFTLHRKICIQKLFKCKVCDSRFTTKQSCYMHTRKRHLEEEFNSNKCTICKITFENSKLLTRHALKKHGDMIEKLPEQQAAVHGDDSCQKCGYQSKNSEDYSCYCSNRKIFKCKVCDSQFSTKQRCYIHTKTKHLEEEPDSNTCKICKITFANTKMMIKHALKKHGDMIEKLSDENTNESVNIPEQNLRKNELKDSLTVFHDQKIDDSVDTHAQKSEKRDIEDLSEEVLNQKLKSEKSDEIDQSTDSRGHGKNLPKKIIKRRKRMPKGQNTDSKTREGVCEHCGEYFKFLSQHILFKHEEYKPFKCEECDYSHASKHGLWLHFASHHRKESELPVCHLCGQKFKSNFNLRVHVESVHENKKNYSCDQCGAEFYFKRKFKWHMKVKHLGEKFKCKDCGEEYGNSESLRTHVQVVHKHMKFICNLCNGQYSSRSCLLKHRKEVHEGKKRRTKS